jgi:hypothetical protein
MGKSKLLIGALITAFALSMSVGLADAHSAKQKGKSSKPTTAAQCAKKWKSYNPVTMNYFGKDGKFHNCP